MRSTFSVSIRTWALAGCLALSLGCMQGEGERCEIDSDCKSGLTCRQGEGSPNDGTCRVPLGSGAGGSAGQSTGADTSTATSTATSTDTSVGTSTETSTPDASVAPLDASVAPLDGSPDADLTAPDATLVD